MKTRTMALLVFGFSMALYAPSIRNRFAYDDHVAVSLDERIHTLSHAERIFTRTYWHDPELGLYRPLTSLTLAVDWTVSGGNPHWFHFMNTLWNAIAVTLAFLLLLVFVPAVPALLGALLFAVHPVHVEAVANIVGRAEVLTGLFSFAAMLLWTRNTDDVTPRRGRLAAITALYVLAMLSKESGIMLPALIGVCDIARRRLTPSTFRAWLRLHAATFVTLTVAAVLYMVARSAVIGGVGPAIVDPTLDIATTNGTRIMTALQAWPIIARLLFFPLQLLLDYGPPIILPALSVTPRVALGGIILVSLVFGGLIAWDRGHHRLAAALLFLPVALLPTSNLIIPIGIIVAERTLYLPSFALAMAAAFGAAAFVERRGSIRLPAIALGCIIALFAARTLLRLPVWRNTTTAFAALERDRPDSFRLKWFRARVAVNEDKPKEAVKWYAEALRTWPYNKKVLVEAAGYAAEHGDLAFTYRTTAFAVERWPDDILLIRMRAGVQLDVGDRAGAVNTIAKGLRLSPTDTTLNAMRRAISPDGAR